MTYKLYGTFTIEEANAIGEKFLARCIGARGYEDRLTTGKKYVITIEPAILKTRPMCSFIDNKSEYTGAHLERFEKIKALSGDTK